MNTPTSEGILEKTTELRKRWRAQVDKELQGAPFERKLVTVLPEGIAVQPLYGPAEQPEDLSCAERRGLARKKGGWATVQTWRAEDPVQVNARLLDGLNKGLNAVALSEGDTPWGQAEWEVALRGVRLDAVPLYFASRGALTPTWRALVAAVRALGGDPASLNGGGGSDPWWTGLQAGVLPEVGRWGPELVEVTGLARRETPQWATLWVEAGRVAEAGGTRVEELAYALAAASETLQALTGTGLAAAEVAARLRVGFSSGPDFFLEVAKLRAWRELWVQFLAPWGVAVAPRVHGWTAEWNKSLLDRETNLLRTTTEACAAVWGGVESLEIRSYDAPAGVLGEIPLRLARNLHTLLAEEFQVADPLDPVGGSWYVESLTTELAQRAWQRFQEIEAGGGLTEGLRSGRWQEAVAAGRRELQESTDRRRRIWIGVNQFPNLKDGVWGRVERAKAVPGAGVPIAPLPTWRVAEGFEELRARVAQLTQAGRRPRVFIARMGPPAQHRARADFAAGFLAPAALSWSARGAMPRRPRRRRRRGPVGHPTVCFARPTKPMPNSSRRWGRRSRVAPPSSSPATRRSRSRPTASKG